MKDSNFKRKIFTLTYLVVCSILFVKCGINSKNYGLLEVHVDNIQKFNLVKENYYKDDYKNSILYSIDINLENNTNSIVEFDIMSCSWANNFTFNCEALEFYSTGCDNNAPIIMQIPIKDKITFKGVIRIIDTLKIKKDNNNFQIGFVMIGKGNRASYSDIRNAVIDKIKSENNSVIWSNAFELKK